MTFTFLDDSTAVAPQILPDNIPALVDAGFDTVICNRPDMEVPPEASSEALRAACEAAGLTFYSNPLAPGGLTMDAINAQAEAIRSSNGKVLAYCASGTRSALLWAFASAASNTHSPEDIEVALEKSGYPFPGISQQLMSVAVQSG